MMLGVIFNWIKAEATQINWTEATLISTAVVSAGKAVENLTGIKTPLSWIWNRIKYCIMLLPNISKKLSLIMSRLDAIESEVKYNGGKELLKDVVRGINIMSIDTKIMVEEVRANQLVADMVDTQMKFRLDSKGACVFVNPTLLNYFGWIEDDMKGFNWKNNIGKDYTQAVQLEWARARVDKSTFESTHEWLDKHGRTHLCHVKGVAMFIDDQFKGHYGILDVINQNTNQN